MIFTSIFPRSRDPNITPESQRSYVLRKYASDIPYLTRKICNLVLASTANQKAATKTGLRTIGLHTGRSTILRTPKTVYEYSGGYRCSDSTRTRPRMQLRGTESWPFHRDTLRCDETPALAGAGWPQPGI